MNGFGKMNLAQNGSVDKINYEGYYRDNIKDGNGTMNWKSGQSYTGGWKNDIYHGIGKLLYPSGDV